MMTRRFFLKVTATIAVIPALITRKKTEVVNGYINLMAVEGDSLITLVHLPLIVKKEDGFATYTGKALVTKSGTAQRFVGDIDGFGYVAGDVGSLGSGAIMKLNIVNLLTYGEVNLNGTIT